MGQDCAPMVLEYLQCRWLHGLSGQLFQCSVTHTVKNFLIIGWNFLCVSFCPLPLVVLFSTTKKSLAPPSWHPSFRYLQTLMGSPLSLHQPKQAQLRQPLKWCDPLTFVALCWNGSRSSMPSLFWVTQNFPRCRALHLLLLNFRRFLTSYPSTPMRSFWRLSALWGIGCSSQLGVIWTCWGTMTANKRLVSQF